MTYVEIKWFRKNLECQWQQQQQQQQQERELPISENPNYEEPSDTFNMNFDHEIVSSLNMSTLPPISHKPARMIIRDKPGFIVHVWYFFPPCGCKIMHMISVTYLGSLQFFPLRYTGIYTFFKSYHSTHGNVTSSYFSSKCLLILFYSDSAPPRPPLPSQEAQYGPETTDDESEELFHYAPSPNQGPIMLAARDLHQEVKQWSSKDNDIIAAAKRMALLMAKLSQLVGQDASSKRELISCAKAIADASEEVTRIAKDLAKDCTDKRMRMVRVLCATFGAIPLCVLI